MSKPAKKFLFVIDMQNDFCDPDGALSNPECTQVIQKVQELIDSGNWEGIIATKDTHFDDYMQTQEGRNLPIPHCQQGTWGHELCVEFPEDVAVVITEKPAFGYEALPDIVEELVDEIGDIDDADDVEFWFCGVCTDICVISNVMIMKAAYPEVPVKIVAGACAGLTPEKHEHALDVMASVQCEIV